MTVIYPMKEVKAIRVRVGDKEYDIKKLDPLKGPGMPVDLIIELEDR